MKLSIIIPMYNSEAFVSKCLDSCLRQKAVFDYEIIVINDGSTDNGPRIVEDYMKRSSVIMMVTQPNGGLSSARNLGLKNAHGEYVWFVDSDDWIASDSFPLLKPVLASKPDVIPIRAVSDINGRVRNKIPSDCRTGKEVLTARCWEHCAPFYIFNRSFLENNALSFFVGIYHEDSEFTPRMLYLARSVVVLPQVLYYVYANIHSITRSLIAKKSYDNIIVCDNLHRFDQEVVIEDCIHKRFNDLISMLINNALANIVLFDKGEQSRFDAYLYKRKFLLRSLGQSSFKYKIEFALFALFPRHYVSVYSLLKRIECKG